MKDLDIYISGIYCLYNKVTRKRYSGQAIIIQQRVDGHVKKLKENRHCNLKLQNAYNKYGPSVWEVQILEEVRVYGDLRKKKVRKRLNRKLTIAEQFWIDYYDSVENGYNICEFAGSMLGYKHTLKQRKKMSKNGKGKGKGKKFTKEHKKKMSESQKGRLVDDTTKRKISKSLSGKNHPNFGKHLSEETKRKIGTANSGHKVSKQTRKQISDRLKGSVVSKETRLKRSGKNNPWYGKHLSKEHRKKISDSNKGKNKGKKASPETLRKMSKASKGRPNSMKGKKLSKEWRRKISLGLASFHKSL